MLPRLVTLPRLAALVGAVLLRGRIIDAIEAVLQACTGQRRKAALNSFLRGNFAPVRCERGPEECKVVEGALPEALDGVFLRIGPDPVVEPTGVPPPTRGCGARCWRSLARSATLGCS